MSCQVYLTRSNYQYQVVLIPKFRRKVFYSHICKDLGRVSATLAREKECQIETGRLQPDRLNMLISIPPKCSDAQVIGYTNRQAYSHPSGATKGNSANNIART